MASSLRIFTLETMYADMDLYLPFLCSNRTGRGSLARDVQFSTVSDGDRGRNLGGGAIAAAMVTGTAAVTLAVVSATSGHFEAAALALLGAAVAFVGVA